MELNRDQVVKALENAIRLGKFYSYMTPKLSYEELRGALALIRELAEENERLRAETIDYRNIPYIIAETKADTVRKMQERLLDTKIKICNDYYIFADNVKVISSKLLEEGK